MTIPSYQTKAFEYSETGPSTEDPSNLDCNAGVAGDMTSFPGEIGQDQELFQDVDLQRLWQECINEGVYDITPDLGECWGVSHETSGPPVVMTPPFGWQ